MNITRIYAVILRYMYTFKHSYDRLTDAFYWPALDLLLWGLTGYYFASISSDTTTAVVGVLSGLIFWIIIWRAQYEVTINLLTELWDKNLINFFGAPLKFSEWIVSVMIVGIIKAFLSFLFAALLAYVFYKVNIFMYGWYLVMFVTLLLLSGWAVGFLVSSILMRYGTKVQTLGWGLVWALAPFAAIYYPLSILPNWAQTIARLLPPSYVFEQMRSFLYNHTVDMGQLGICLGLNIIYLALGFISINMSFKALKKKGLAKLH